MFPGLSGGSVEAVLNKSPRRMSWRMSGLLVWVGLIGAANVSLPRYKIFWPSLCDVRGFQG
jgi:hypothetical protein